MSDTDAEMNLDHIVADLDEKREGAKNRVAPGLLMREIEILARQLASTAAMLERNRRTSAKNDLLYFSSSIVGLGRRLEGIAERLPSVTPVRKPKQ